MVLDHSAQGGDYSAGLVYDSRLYRPPERAHLGDKLKAHLLTHPVGREIFADAQYIEGDVKAYSALPYYSAKIAARERRQIVGDAASFLDPLYSQGSTIARGLSRRLSIGSREKGGERPAT